MFSVFDSHTKHRVHRHIDRHGKVPPWMAAVGEVTGYLTPPGYKDFSMIDPATGVKVWGSPDAILIKPDKSLMIIDYKTSSPNSDFLHPIYLSQLNAYAMISALTPGFGRISELALVYCHPGIDPLADDGDNSFPVQFTVTVKPLPLDTKCVTDNLVTIKAVADMKTTPKGREGCKNCVKLDELFALKDAMSFDINEAKRAFAAMR